MKVKDIYIIKLNDPKIAGGWSEGWDRGENNCLAMFIGQEDSGKDIFLIYHSPEGVSRWSANKSEYTSIELLGNYDDSPFPVSSITENQKNVTNKAFLSGGGLIKYKKRNKLKKNKSKKNKSKKKNNSKLRKSKRRNFKKKISKKKKI